LTLDQLEFLALYEAAHQNRVTLLQAIKQEHEARREAVPDSRYIVLKKAGANCSGLFLLSVSADSKESVD
jgi:hypothetical protein